MTSTLPAAGVRAVGVAAPAAHRSRQCSIPAQIGILTARSLRGAFGDPKLVFFGLAQPVVLLLLFSQVFRQLGTLSAVRGYDGYINYLMPATAVNVALATAMGSAVGVLTEIYTGFVSRLRTMPISLVTVLVARTLADAARLAVSLVVIVGCAVAFLHFRPASIVGTVAALALTVVVGWAMGWLFVALATWQRRAETMQAASFVVMFPLMFSSSAYVPLAALPAWLRAVARVNPLTYAIDAARRLTSGQPVGTALLWTLLSSGAVAAAGALVAVRNFRRAG